MISGIVRASEVPSCAQMFAAENSTVTAFACPTLSCNYTAARITNLYTVQGIGNEVENWYGMSKFRLGRVLWNRYQDMRCKRLLL